MFESWSWLGARFTLNEPLEKILPAVRVLSALRCRQGQTSLGRLWYVVDVISVLQSEEYVQILKGFLYYLHTMGADPRQCMKAVRK